MHINTFIGLLTFVVTGIVMIPLQLSLAELFSSATKDTQNVDQTVQGTVTNLLSILYYLTLAVIMIGIFYYGANLALGKNPSEAKTKLLYVSLALIVIYLLPLILDYIATGHGQGTQPPSNPGPSRGHNWVT